MNKIGSEVKGRRVSRYRISKRTHAGQRHLGSEREFANHALVGAILSSVMTGPRRLCCAVLIGIITAEENAGFVAIDDLVEPPSRLTSGGIAEVLLVVSRTGPETVDVIPGMVCQDLEI